MAHKTKAQTIFKWLRDNGIPLGALTDHDGRALRAAVEIAELWICGDYDNRKKSEVAFKHVVEQMQDKCQYMAFHSIAHCGDWCHRWELWRNAGLSQEVLKHVPECKFGPRKRTQEDAPAPTCDCGEAGSWHGDPNGYRTFCCDECWAALKARLALIKNAERA